MQVSAHLVMAWPSPKIARTHGIARTLGTINSGACTVRSQKSGIPHSSRMPISGAVSSKLSPFLLFSLLLLLVPAADISHVSRQLPELRPQAENNCLSKAQSNYEGKLSNWRTNTQAGYYSFMVSFALICVVARRRDPATRRCVQVTHDRMPFISLLCHDPTWLGGRLANLLSCAG